MQTVTKKPNNTGTPRAHKRKRTEQHSHKCQTCDKVFARTTSLKIHNRIHTGERPYPCSKCPHKSIQLNHLNKHMLTHTGKKEYQCETCGKTFARSDALDQHSITHAKNRLLFACRSCSHLLKSRNGLKIHAQKHTGKELFYSCPYEKCDKVFINIRHLNEHRQTHKAEQPLNQQPGPSHASEQQTQPAVDQSQSHTKAKFFACPYKRQCNQSFTSEADYKQHILKHEQQPFDQ